MKLDVRDDPHGLTFNAQVFDKVTGKSLPYVVAVDDATGQIVRYPYDEEKVKFLSHVVYSEIRDIEIVLGGQ